MFRIRFDIFIYMIYFLIIRCQASEIYYESHGFKLARYLKCIPRPTFMPLQVDFILGRLFICVFIYRIHIQYNI